MGRMNPLIEVREDLFDHPESAMRSQRRGVSDAGSAMQAMMRIAPPHTGAVLDADIEHALEAFRQAHRRPALVICARCARVGANTPWKRERFTRGFGTSAASRAIESNALEWHVRGAVAVRGLERASDASASGERQARLRHRRAAAVWAL